MICRILLASVALTVTLPAVLQPAPVAAAMAPADFTQLERISIQAMGSGSPVILIPGLSSPRAVWEGQVAAIAAKHRVYLVQVNGFGGDDPRANLSPGLLDGMVAELHGFIAANRLEGAAVIGHSMGGLAGLMLAKAHPGDVGRLMVVDSLPFVGVAFVPGSTVESLRPQAAALRDQMAASYGQPMQVTADSPQLATMAASPAARTRIAEWMKAADPRVTGLALYEDMTTDLRPDMAGIATPITLVYPWSDAMPQSFADGFYRGEYAAAPHVSFVPVGGSRHFVMLDQPEAFAGAVAAFLKD